MFCIYLSYSLISSWCIYILFFFYFFIYLSFLPVSLHLEIKADGRASWKSHLVQRPLSRDRLSNWFDQFVQTKFFHSNIWFLLIWLDLIAWATDLIKTNLYYPSIFLFKNSSIFWNLVAWATDLINLFKQNFIIQIFDFF